MRILIYSYKRAMQLRACIDSLLLHCKDIKDATIRVNYDKMGDRHAAQYMKLAKEYPKSIVQFTERKEFKEDTLKYIERAKHVMFLVDDNVFVSDFRLSDIESALSRNLMAIGFSLRYGDNICENYTRRVKHGLPDFDVVTDEILRYNWPTAPPTFDYPLEVSSSVYRVENILFTLRNLCMTNPNIFEANWSRQRILYAKSLPHMLCYNQSKAFCIPCNKVQDVFNNEAGKTHAYSSDQLADMFDKGKRIDVAALSGFVPKACHQELELRFIDETGTSI